MTTPSKRLLLFTAKLGYQTRSFEEAALKLGVQLFYVTDRCHQLEDPWGDRAIAVHFENPEVAAYIVMEAVRGQNVDGILALGDRPAVAAAYAARSVCATTILPPWRLAAASCVCGKCFAMRGCACRGFEIFL
jgi:hypothetical protein